MGNNWEFHTFRGYQMLVQEKEQLTPSMEDYMEMIFRNCLDEGYVRISSLAKQLNVRASSVSKIVQKLSSYGLLKYEKYGIIQLTGEGERVGEFLLHRHKTIETFLLSIGGGKTALRETEMIEHHISINTLRNIEMLNEFFEQYPDILKKYNQFKKSRHKKQEKSTY